MKKRVCLRFLALGLIFLLLTGSIVASTEVHEDPDPALIISEAPNTSEDPTVSSEGSDDLTTEAPEDPSTKEPSSDPVSDETSDLSEESPDTIVAEFLDAPANVPAPEISSYTPTTFTVTWKEIPGISNYQVQYSKYADFRKVGSRDVADTSAKITGRTCGDLYYIKVRSVLIFNEQEYYSNWSDPISVVPNVKAADVTIKADTYKALVLSWEAVYGADSYEIYRSTSSDGTYTLLQSQAETGYRDTSVKHACTYYYKVVPKRKGVSGPAEPVHGKARCKAPVVTLTQADYKTLQLSWKSVPGAEYYSIYRSEAENGSYTRISRGTALSFTDSDLQKGHCYFYKVYPVRDKKAGIGSKILRSNVYPAKPASFKVRNIGTQASDGAKLTWAAAAYIDRYLIYRSTSPSSGFKQIASVEGTSTSYLDYTTEDRVTYYYKIKASNAWGNSVFSTCRTFCFADYVNFASTKLSMIRGNTQTITVNTEPAEASAFSYTFSSSDPSVVTVSSTGKLTAVGPGKATITCTTLDKSDSSYLTITVTQHLTIVLDPGHGGTDCGAVGQLNGTTYYERDLNFKISSYTKSYLEQYRDVTVILTHNSTSEYYTLQERADIAHANKASVLISQHLNSAQSSAKGCEVWISVNKKYALPDLASLILDKVTSLGITRRNIGARSYDTDASTDYYGIIRGCVGYGIPALIIENAFISSPTDLSNYLNTTTKLKRIALANATAIAEYYGLVKK